MKVPKINNYSTEELYERIKINDIPTVKREYHIMNDKDRIRLIRNIETIVRRSIEYKQFIKFLKDEIDMSQCTFFNNVNNKDGRKISIEIHHEPFTLFDIVDIILEKYIIEDEELNPLMIAEEVMGLHYKNMVGLIPLAGTVHDLIHDGKLFVPLQYIFGDYLKFLEDYNEYIPDHINEKLEVKLRMSKELELDTSILNKKFVYLELDGFTLPEVIQ